jgi:H+-transporting ATPase
MGISELTFFIALLAIGKYGLGFGIEALRTLAFLAVVFGNQATTYANRTRQHLWSIRPSFLLILSSVVDLSIASAMASFGIAMAPLPLVVMGGTLAGAAVFAIVVDIVKVPVFNRLEIA